MHSSSVLKYDHERTICSKKSWSNQFFIHQSERILSGEVSLAQYEAGITEAPNHEVPCLVLYTKLMSELILEAATNPGLCPDFYTFSLYWPE